MLPQGLKMVCAPPVWRLYCATVRVPPFPVDELSAPSIFACLHRDILPAIIHVRSARPSLLVSRSPDGEILLRTLGRQNYGFVRGATGEGGQRAFMALRRELDRGHCVGLAVDGPKGPFGVVNEGAIQLSRLTGAPIVPLLAVAERPIVLNTWDRTVVPRPFSSVAVRRGADLVVPRDAGESDLAAARRSLEKFFGVGGEDLAHP